jgi:type II secretory pathway component PulM
MATSIERLRDRWDQISPREQRMVLALGITFVLVVLVLLGRGITSGLAELEAKNQKTRQALRVLQDYRQTAGAGNGEAQEVKLPDEPVKLQSYLEGIAGEVGITIPGFNPQAGATRDGVVTAATRFQLRSISLEQLTSFLEKVETKLPYVVVESLEIDRDFRDNSKLEVDLLVTTYANAKKETSGEGGKDAKDAKDKPAKAAAEEEG